MSTRSAGRRRLLDEIIHSMSPVTESDRDSWQNLIKVVRSRSRLLSNAAWSTGQPDDMLRMAGALCRIATRRLIYRRQPESWVAPHGSVRVQFSSLVEHLFTRYPVPVFLKNCWFDPGQYSTRDINLFIAIGNGIRLRDCQLPIRLTRAFARHFFSAPHDLSVNDALRWAQVTRCGGTPRLARILIDSIPVAVGNQDEFWTEVIEFMVRADEPKRCGPLSKTEFGEIIRFVHKLRFRPASELLGLRLESDRPLCPTFSLKRRSIRFVRRTMANWRQELASEIAARQTIRNGPNLWPASGIGAFGCREGSARWTIEELRDARSLAIEGAIMQHCVGESDYIQSCAKRYTTIWSLRRWSQRTSRRVVTIEVDPASRQIVQCQGKCNSTPGHEAAKIIEEWARCENLKLPESDSGEY